MTLRFHKKFRLGGVTFRSGGIYTFEYVGWQHDPKPVILFIHKVSGTHPRTGNEWRHIQAINFTYIPRAFRRLFATTWISMVGNASTFKRGNMSVNWPLILQRFPYLKNATRRYFWKPPYYIHNIREVPFDEWEKEIMSTMSKDFSKKVRGALKQKYKKALGGFRNIRQGFRRIFGGRV
jgi:hypothetical protein